MTARIAAAAPAAAVLALLLAAIACAPGATTDDEPPADTDATDITVVHDIPAATSLTVHLVDPLGTTRRLGVVRPGAREVFPLPGRPVSGDYQLVAELADGRTYTSRPFILTGRAGIEWSPADNLLTPISGP